ncbi:MAG: hypothetical protein V3R52_08590 [Candidatus Neomarinimicrobiota bacterium]
MKVDPKSYIFKEQGSLGTIALIIGAVGLVLSVFGYFGDSRQFYFSYLTSFVFWVSLGLGGLFFTMLHHISGSKWSTVLIRISQAAMSVLPMMIILFIPIFFGIKELYSWSHPEIVAESPALQGKSGFLNIPFFTVRTIIYFAVWGILTFLINKYSQRQDDGINTTKQLRIVSAPGMFLFALTISFAAFDWLMSLDPLWFSTIFGAYYFGGSFVIIIAFLIIIANYLNSNNILNNEIGPAHFSDLGKLLFGFIVFWAYLGGAQYFFIWYANIPEETVWFLDRWQNSWRTVSILLIFGHFLIPFISLIFFNTKRNRKILVFFAFWMFLFHYVDMYWLVVPAFHHEAAKISWLDLTTFFGIGGVFIALFWNRFTSKAILPLNDPYLSASINSNE